MLHSRIEETFIQIVVTVFTNFPLAICAAVIWKRFGKRGAVEALIALTTCFVSIMYHLAECLRFSHLRQTHLLGMSDGQWHRLDNVFSILSMQNLWYYFMDIEDRETVHILRWATFFFALWCQERGPWQVIFTIIPILVTVVMCVLKYVLFSPLPKIKVKPFLVGLSFGLIAIIFFIRGLDDDNDWVILFGARVYRWNHGLWHFFGGFSFSYFVTCIETRNEVKRSDVKKNV
eukprot:TRINITY_DN7908_c0_g1_i1.p1 TRINITY_DN7908_c0_g1~~TRINITY_DN7908_c0_g1_i1.p1  ORF type:complete len:232 (-),score=5.63 TRINITY_DN7908_c0_g1_i1:39-734(-)